MGKRQTCRRSGHRTRKMSSGSIRIQLQQLYRGVGERPPRPSPCPCQPATAHRASSAARDCAAPSRSGRPPARSIRGAHCWTTGCRSRDRFRHNCAVATRSGPSGAHRPARPLRLHQSDTRPSRCLSARCSGASRRSVCASGAMSGKQPRPRQRVGGYVNNLERVAPIELPQPAEYPLVGHAGRHVHRATQSLSTSIGSTVGQFPESAPRVSQVLYACPNVETSLRLVRLDLGAPGSMRAPGEASGSFALESATGTAGHSTPDPVRRGGWRAVGRARPGRDRGGAAPCGLLCHSESE
jgi:hypothetical protein